MRWLPAVVFIFGVGVVSPVWATNDVYTGNGFSDPTFAGWRAKVFANMNANPPIGKEGIFNPEPTEPALGKTTYFGTCWRNKSTGNLDTCSGPTAWSVTHTGDPGPQCTAGVFTPGVWPQNGGATACHEGCETQATIQIGGDSPTFGTVTTGNTCPSTSPPPDQGPGDPKPGYTPDDPNDPSKGGTYCTSNPTVCVHGPAPNTGGSGGTPGGSDGGSTGGSDGGGSTGGGSTGGGDDGGSTGGGDDGGSTGGGSTGGGSTGGGSTGGGTGTGGGSTGGGTGTGDTGSGDGSGDGTGDKDCTAGDACHAGSPGGVPGQLYKPDGSSVASVFGDFAAKAKQTPLVSAASGFFDIGNISGSCPTWTLPESEWLPAMTFDFYCNATALEIIGWAGWVVLCVGAFRAFEIAMY